MEVEGLTQRHVWNNIDTAARSLQQFNVIVPVRAGEL